jgi:hypothetical protein
VETAAERLRRLDTDAEWQRRVAAHRAEWESMKDPSQAAYGAWKAWKWAIRQAKEEAELEAAEVIRKAARRHSWVWPGAFLVILAVAAVMYGAIVLAEVVQVLGL